MCIRDRVMDADEDINFSRIPIFKENIDNITGIVYKDTLLETMADDYFEKSMSDISEPVETVFEKESVETVLNKFTKNRSHIFIVKDESSSDGVTSTIADSSVTKNIVLVSGVTDEAARIVYLPIAASLGLS